MERGVKNGQKLVDVNCERPLTHDASPLNIQDTINTIDKTLNKDLNDALKKQKQKLFFLKQIVNVMMM